MRKVVLRLDNDNAGREAMERIAAKLAGRGYDDVIILLSQNKYYNEDIKTQNGMKAIPAEPTESEITETGTSTVSTTSRAKLRATVNTARRGSPPTASCNAPIGRSPLSLSSGGAVAICPMCRASSSAANPKSAAPSRWWPKATSLGTTARSPKNITVTTSC
ncbi:MAG: toprim domain-containing protein [Clostridiales bacterium]|nr:toprim domain-containing protein [Clostridiales bacterium]